MDEKMVGEFEREAALMVNMKQHQNVLQTFGVCIDTGGNLV